LKDAADVIMQSPTALQLRYLQTLTTIASEKNSTIVFPIPVKNMINGFNITSDLETQL
jgi:erythrocyte band 7 integral membrane protein